MWEQIASIAAPVEDAVIRLFPNACQATESSPDMKLIPVIYTVVNMALAKRVRSAAFFSVVGDKVHNCIPEPPSADAAAARLVDARSLTVPARRFGKHEVVKKRLR